MEWVNERSTRSKTTNRTIGTQNTALHTERIASTYGCMENCLLYCGWISLCELDSNLVSTVWEWSNLSVLCFQWAWKVHIALSVLIFFALSSSKQINFRCSQRRRRCDDKFSIFNFLFPHCCYSMSTWVWNRQFIHNSFVINLFSRYFSLSLQKILFCFFLFFFI